VYLPKEKVLCTGDAATNGPYNYTADANVGNWPKVMDRALKLNVEHVLPGHGPAGGKEVLQGEREFMIALHQAASDAVKAGKKLDDIVKKEGDKLTTTVQLPQAVHNWVGDGLAQQVSDAYNEVAKGKPAGDIPHE
jgi:glyoxylase-like metal-dependent hydrolase (beta-lactamase superfamily II)